MLACQQIVRRRRSLRTRCQLHLIARRKFQENGQFVLMHLLDEVLDNASIDIVQRVGQISRTLRTAVKSYLLRRVQDVLQQWINDPTEFRFHLGMTRSVVGGSAVLGVVLRDSWQPSDLDIYCPYGRTAALAHYLCHDEGYDLVKYINPYLTNTTADDAQTVDIQGITSVTKFKRLFRDGMVRKVDLIESKDAYALSPLVHADMTLTMNWITGNTVTVGYPLTTFRHFSVWRNETSNSGRKKWRRMYEDRGFGWSDWDEWETRRVKLGHHGASCPGLLRSSDDSLCFRMSFKACHPQSFWQSASGILARQCVHRVWTMHGRNERLICYIATCLRPSAPTWAARDLLFRQKYHYGICQAGLHIRN